MTNDYIKPCRVMYKIKRGFRTTLGYYDLIKKMREQKRLVCAWSTSTGKRITG